MTAFLSSYFLAPALLAFLGLIPIVILLYLLKLRRTEVIVPSTMLWIRSLQDLTANAPFQRLRKNLLLLLQVLTLLLLAIALGRPFFRAEGAAGTSLCLLMDCSASMQTLEEDGSRLDIAKERALDMVQQLRGGDKMMIVSFADRAEVLCELTDDRFRLRGAIESVQPRDTATKVRDALLIAHSLAQSRPDLQVVVVSDGNIADLEDIGTRDVNVRFLQIGETARNAGIVAFSQREAPQGERVRQSFALVHNDTDEALETTLSLYFNDTLLAVEEVAVPPNGDAEVLFGHGELGTGLLRLTLDIEDALAVDNTAWLALRPAASIQALLVSEGGSVSGYYLKRALMLEERVRLSSVTPENYGYTEDYDLVIFDGYAPDTLPQGTLLFVNALPPIAGLESLGAIERPPVLARDADHPVMRFLNPSTVGILQAQRVSLPPGGRALLSTEGGPLIADVSRGGQQILLITFDIGESNWPWHLSFPLFVQNVATWVPRSTLAQEQSIPAGSPLTLTPSPDAEQAVVTRPGGVVAVMDLDPIRPTYYGATGQTGVYKVARGESIEHYAVNLLDRNESAVRPAARLAIGRAEIEAEYRSIKQNQELWRWFALAAVALLALEWWIYSRRAWM